MEELTIASEKAKTKNDQKNIHDGHRKRLRNLYLNTNLDAFSPHNVLELLLGYSKVRGDTNPLAHHLMNEYGSISGVLEASVEDLCKIPGIGITSATLLHMMPDLFRYYAKDKISDVNVLKSFEDIKSYCETLFVGISVEITYLICLDNKAKILSVNKIGEGSVTANQINTRLILDCISKVKSNLIILSHNHPQGVPRPSPEDLRTTKELMDIFKPIGVTLYDHVIVAKMGVCSMKEMNVLNNIL